MQTSPPLKVHPGTAPAAARGAWAWLARWLFALALLVAGVAAQAQGVELATLKATRADGALNLDFAARVTLPRTVEEALTRGVPVYFVAEATLFRSRWYWRDDRIARVSRSWRVAFQPLTGSWRVGLGGISQTHATLADALAAATSSAGWKLVDLAQIEGDKGHYIEFEFKLDTAQLPGPMQFGLSTAGEWALGVSRTLRVD
jgi:hypothetical protein